jgi:hypothetical protein
MNSDQLRQLLNQSYNPPPNQIPREEMWGRIRHARNLDAPEVATPRETIWQGLTRQRAAAASSRSGQRRSPAAPRISARDVRIPITPSKLMLAGLSMAAAAALFVMVETRTVPVSGGNSSNSSFTQGAFELPFPGQSALGTTGMTSYAGELPAWISVSAEDPVSEAYKRAAVIHLRRSEAFISGFRTLSDEALVNNNLRSTVRELLSNTRLLLNSQVQIQTQYRGVFLDLEMVLVKMTTLTPRNMASDRSLIENTLEKRKLIPRMRELIPVPASSNAN